MSDTPPPSLAPSPLASAESPAQQPGSSYHFYSLQGWVTHLENQVTQHRQALAQAQESLRRARDILAYYQQQAPTTSVSPVSPDSPQTEEK